ncbi:hypothetical protein BpHYR1_020223 [Brachionus plicatilis]|uniref:Uncharacterized protein n=1 Tax=Brachionus plicatilis TaxID=10195 RepID=A0A3M7RIM0_BRAPC|nr:hypothetical protein BpHYR1_020223 [Brachionus plicatilis]
MWLGIKSLDKVANVDINKLVKQKSVVEKLRRRQFGWNAEGAKSELENLAMDHLLWKKNVTECCKPVFD